ncbi:hypothetical protein QN277_008161 [Acacia crassicarpa]|uniref:Uncharacterized protein n=1 Tax=Acacia crassicarpa TaxID=499986 RepID=A0AAE1JL50_9FABA|nr:hypothetical protein QN277_008161 [Acacia crassicarpa]
MTLTLTAYLPASAIIVHVLHHPQLYSLSPIPPSLPRFTPICTTIVNLVRRHFHRLLSYHHILSFAGE